MVQLWKSRRAKRGVVFDKSSITNTSRRSTINYKSLFSARMLAIVSIVSVAVFGASTIDTNKPASAKQLAVKADSIPATEKLLLAASHDDSSESQHDYSPVFPEPVYEELDLGGTSRQVTAIQQQIMAFMQGCVEDARQIHSTLVMYKQQEQEIDDLIDALREQRRAISYREEGADIRRSEIDTEIDHLRLQERELRDIYNADRRILREVSRSCRRGVNDLQKQKRDAERHLERQFRDSLNLKI